MQKWYYHQ